MLKRAFCEPSFRSKHARCAFLFPLGKIEVVRQEAPGEFAFVVFPQSPSHTVTFGPTMGAEVAMARLTHSLRDASKAPLRASSPKVLMVAGVLVVALGGAGLWFSQAGGSVELVRNESAKQVSESSQESSSSQDQNESDEDKTRADSEVIDSRSLDAKAASETSSEVHEVTKVHVDGAVATPGVYELMGSDLRVEDAVQAAGGLSESADTFAMNLAAPVADGDKVHVPSKEENQPQVSSVADASSGSSAKSARDDGSNSQGSSSHSININTATVEELCDLPGVGEATAQKIVDDREAHGAFSSPEDLMRVSGIGEKKFEKMKDLVCV